MLSPAADVQPFSGSWLAELSVQAGLAGSTALGHLDADVVSQLEPCRVFPPRYIPPATLTESESVCRDLKGVYVCVFRGRESVCAALARRLVAAPLLPWITSTVYAAFT